MSMPTELIRYLKAGFSGLWIESNEPNSAVADIFKTAADANYSCVVWEPAQHLLLSADLDRLPSTSLPPELLNAGQREQWRVEPSRFMMAIPALARGIAAAITEHRPEIAANHRTLFVFRHIDADVYLKTNPVQQQAMLNIVQDGQAVGYSAIIVSTQVQLPRLLDRSFTVITHDLPDKQELWSIASSVAAEGELPSTETGKADLLEAAAGLTRREAENAFALSIVDKQPFKPEIVWSLKSQMLKKNGLLTLYEGKDSFGEMGGMQQFRTFCKQLLKPQSDPLLFARGLLLLGVPGAGKTQAVKCMANEYGRRVLMLNMGQLRSKWQGETDQNIRQVLALADAMAPNILFVD